MNLYIDTTRAKKIDRSFSEVITAHLETETKIADVAGQQMLNPETAERVSEEITRLSSGTMDRLTDDAT